MGIQISIIILSYNTKEITQRCISSLLKSLPSKKDFVSEVIVVDNGSNDGSVKNLKDQKSKIKNKKVRLRLILNKKNLGYPKGNNQALKISSGKYILFLNSDTIVDKIDFKKLLNYLDNHSDVGVLTVKVTLPDGSIDPASHRGFPTIWNSFCYFIGLEEIFKNLPLINKIFGGYHLAYLDIGKIHEIDSPCGAFYLTKNSILKKIGGFDESFFMYGEDLDLSFRIKKQGYKIVYYPNYNVVHLKRASGLEKSEITTRESTRKHFYNAMKIFYKKHYEKNHHKVINNMIYFFINVLRNTG